MCQNNRKLDESVPVHGQPLGDSVALIGHVYRDCLLFASLGGALVELERWLVAPFRALVAALPIIANTHGEGA